MAEVKRRKGESFDSMLRRFSKRIQQSGRLLQAKKTRYHAKEKNKNSARESALRRLEIAEKRDYLIKIGRLVDERRHGSGGYRKDS